MGATAVPAIQLGPLGLLIPTESAILTGVLADFNTAFGGNMNLNLNTPQGQLASTEAALIADYNNQFLLYVNGFDPAYNSGRQQDAIARIYFIERNPAEPTVVNVTCTGAVNTVIPAGSLISDSSNNLYANANSGTIGAGGTAVIPFSNTQTGPIPCPANTINSAPYRQVTGWDSASNASDGVLGQDVESTQAFEARRLATVANNANATVSAIRGNVLLVPNVLDCYVTENPTGAPVTTGGVTLAANSVYVCVSGGDNLAVATAIWQKKPPGCAYTGNTTVTVYDENSGYVMPYPSYAVAFQTAQALAINFLVSLASNPLVPSNAATLVQSAIINAFAGIGGPRATIGSEIFASSFYAAVAALGSWVEIRSITIGSINTTAAAFTASIAGTVMTVSGVASGALAAGQIVSGAGLAAGTQITSLGTGTGGTGTYNLNLPSTTASEAMGSYAASLNVIQTNINQAPALSAPDIVVTVS